MQRFLSVLWGSVIAAAFLGPGTITTAARAGSAHGFSLLWTLLFSTVACLVLQEASARLSAVSGQDLGRALRSSFGDGPRGWPILVLVLGAILLGCAAYEAGNILGGVAGAELVLGIGALPLTLATGVAAGLLLWWGSTRQVVLVLSAMVAAMGLLFSLTALRLAPPLGEILAGMLVPSLPDSSLLLVLGLVGTTVVPYNLFLGSGLARGRDLGEMRFGLLVAIGLGGLISMAVLVVGTAVAGSFDFASLAEVLGDRLGPWAQVAFGLGLFAAGFTSAVTAPLAAAVTARGLFAEDANDPRWGERSARYRGVWMLVLATGLLFGVSGIRPVPAILLAQALNGVLLPVAAVFLLLAINDRRVMGEAGVNGPIANGIALVVVSLCVLLGLLGVSKAASAVLGLPTLGIGPLLTVAGLVMAILAVKVVSRSR